MTASGTKDALYMADSSAGMKPAGLRAIAAVVKSRGRAAGSDQHLKRPRMCCSATIRE